MKRSYLSYPPEVAAEFIEKWEGCRLEAYKCPAGVLTIGVGHTGDDVHEGDVIPYHKALELLYADIKKVVDQLAPFINKPVSEGQFIALTSLAFNVGPHAVKKSTLLRLFNTGHIDDAAEQFHRWVYAAGTMLPGLVKRRQAEYELFMEGEE